MSQSYFKDYRLPPRPIQPNTPQTMANHPQRRCEMHLFCFGMKRKFGSMKRFDVETYHRIDHVIIISALAQKNRSGFGTFELVQTIPDQRKPWCSICTWSDGASILTDIRPQTNNPFCNFLTRKNSLQHPLLFPLTTAIFRRLLGCRLINVSILPWAETERPIPKHDKPVTKIDPAIVRINGDGQNHFLATIINPDVSLSRRWTIPDDALR